MSLILQVGVQTTMGEQTTSGEILVEFYGMARQHVGHAECHLPCSTLQEILYQLQNLYPKLQLFNQQNKLSPLYLLSVNGVRFVDQMETPLHSGDHLIILPRDAGG